MAVGQALGGEQWVLAQWSSLIFYPQGAGKLLLPQPKRRGRGTLAGATGLSTGRTCFTGGTVGKLPGSGTAPAHCRPGALQESRGSPDLPKVTGTPSTELRRAKTNLAAATSRLGRGMLQRMGMAAVTAPW